MVNTYNKRYATDIDGDKCATALFAHNPSSQCIEQCVLSALWTSSHDALSSENDANSFTHP